MPPAFGFAGLFFQKFRTKEDLLWRRSREQVVLYGSALHDGVYFLSAVRRRIWRLPGMVAPGPSLALFRPLLHEGDVAHNLLIAILAQINGHVCVIAGFRLRGTALIVGLFNPVFELLA